MDWATIVGVTGMSWPLVIAAAVLMTNPNVVGVRYAIDLAITGLVCGYVGTLVGAFLGMLGRALARWVGPLVGLMLAAVLAGAGAPLGGLAGYLVLLGALTIPLGPAFALYVVMRRRRPEGATAAWAAGAVVATLAPVGVLLGLMTSLARDLR
ncbi:MAG: hypothetical protein H6738_09815 [Alphaproteobacteria bacterium]|nr:hypothetical protein [Alphaproteobacteria bacterium]MCB9697062.1 hypothetical protein [Alphaproteobacteria bacterium]